MAKKKMTLEEKLEEAIVKDIPYEVPRNWVWIKFGTVCKLDNGYAFKSTNYKESGVPILRISNIKEFGINFDDKTVYSEYDEVLDRYYVNKGDLLIAMSGATTGKTGVYNESEKAYLNQRVGNIKIVEPELITDKFRNYLISYKGKEILDLAYGGAQPNISTAMIEKLNTPIPPLKEQQRIVDKIESLFEKLDKAKELIEEARDDFEKRKSAILEKAFRGGLTKEWRNESNKKYNVLVKFSELFTFVGGGTPSKSNEKYWNGDICWASVKDIKGEYLEYTIDNITEEGVKNSSTNIANVGELILATRISPGKITITKINTAINQDLKIVKNDDNIINKKYAYYLFKYREKEIISKAQGTTVKGITLKELNNMELLLPTIEEQKEIVRILDKLLEEESKIEELTILEDQIELIKKSILSKAFRGQLGTNCEEDESALELLKDILSKDKISK